MSLTGNLYEQLVKSFLIYCPVVRGNRELKYVDFANLRVYKNISSVADVEAWDLFLCIIFM